MRKTLDVGIGAAIVPAFDLEINQRTVGLPGASTPRLSCVVD